MGKYRLTPQEEYLLGYTKGYRIGYIGVLREVLRNTIKVKGKEQGVKPTKALIQKINREIDAPLLSKMCEDLSTDCVTVLELEEKFDMFFSTPEQT